MPDNSKQHGKASGGLIALAAVLALGLGATAWWLAAGSEAPWAAWPPRGKPTPHLFPPLL